MCHRIHMQIYFYFLDIYHLGVINDWCVNDYSYIISLKSCRIIPFFTFPNHMQKKSQKFFQFISPGF